MKMKLGLAMLAASVLTACSSLSPPPPEHFYRLPALAVDQPLSAVVLPGQLVVLQPLSDGLHGGQSMLYSPNPQGLLLHQYDYHLWQDSAPLMIRQYMQDYLGNSGIADSVTAGGDAFNAHWRLSSQLRRFEQWRGEQAATVTVRLNLDLHELGPEGRTVSGSYEEVVRLADASPLASVPGYQRALQRIMVRFIKDVQQGL